jgi:hypothetical protein
MRRVAVRFARKEKKDWSVVPPAEDATRRDPEPDSVIDDSGLSGCAQCLRAESDRAAVPTAVMISTTRLGSPNDLPLTSGCVCPCPLLVSLLSPASNVFKMFLETYDKRRRAPSSTYGA